MANIFKAKTLVGRTGTFSHEVTAPNLVYNTGNQTVFGNKTFTSGNFIIDNASNPNQITPYYTRIYSNDFGIYNPNEDTIFEILSPIGSDDVTNFYSQGSKIIQITGGKINVISEFADIRSNANIYAKNLVYNTGNQNISGNKTFVNNIEIQGTGIFNSVDLSNISEFQFSGVTMNLVDTNTYVSGGWIYISGNPVLTGSQSISTINLDNIVYTTGNQTIEGIKDFNNIINVSGIQFDVLTTPQTPVYQEGLLYYSDSSKTLNLYSDVAGLELPIGQENWLRAKNLTNSTITPGTVVFINGAQGNTPLVQRSIASGDSTSATTVAIAAHSINNNSKGYFTTFGIVENINTSAFNVGDALYLSWTESGKLTGVKPQAPYHMVRIGNVIDQGNNGSIFVNIQNGFEIDELHDVRIINQQNKDGIVYNSASGLWLNTPVALANEVVYLTGDQIINGSKVFTTGIDIYSGTSPQFIRVFNSTGTNSGEFGLFAWQNNSLVIGTQNTISGILRPLVITGDSISYSNKILTIAHGNAGLFIDGTGPTIRGNHWGAGDAGFIKYRNGLDLGRGGSTYLRVDATAPTVIVGRGASTANIVGVGFDGTNSNLDLPDSFIIRDGSGILSLRNPRTNLGNSPQQLRIFNMSGTNTGEFGLFGWINNQLIVGPQQTQSGVLRDLTLTGANININASGVVNIFDNTNIIGSLDVYSGRSPQSLRVFNSTGVNSGEYGIFGWKNNQLIIGAENTQSGILRDVTVTGRNIRVIPNQIFEISNMDSLLLSGLSIVITGSSINILGGRPFVNGTGVLLSGEAAGPGGGVTGPVVMQTGNQYIGGNKTFTGIVTFSGQEINLVDTALNLSGAGDMTFTSTNINFINSPVCISGTNLRVTGHILSNGLSTQDYVLYDASQVASIYWDGRVLRDMGAFNALDWYNRSLLDETENVTLSWSGGQVGIGTNAPSEKLEVNGNIKFGDVPNGYAAKFIMWDPANAVYNTGEWYDGQLILTDAAYATNKSIILNFQGDTNSIESNGSILRLPSGKDDFIAMDAEVIHKTGNEIINGNKTFSQTGEFQAVKLNKNRFLSYDYETGNFNFIDYITIVNSTLSGSGDFVTGILPIGIPDGNISGFNFLLKNINNCPVLITGSGSYTIDGEPNLYIYKGESVELLGVQAVGITGWYTLNTNLGVV